ncbi:hypothetical protein [Ktedonobacter robiniae]|uniref:Uncharacterized protein n=1 Tax=Ktedonobacter robiniae TaxID=2778365 RepID=A0ABQ3UYA7_9CHLR|nr:hypothetical protein [Ktedonobacter robiniae]GHO57342.1 hypothetical protein KSB_58170 [Ktedonobacter robiniae]
MREPVSFFEEKYNNHSLREVCEPVNEKLLMKNIEKDDNIKKEEDLMQGTFGSERGCYV